MIGRIGDVLATLTFGLLLVLLGLAQFSPTPWANDLLIVGGLLVLGCTPWLVRGRV